MKNNLIISENQHWELYTKYDLKEAFLVGYEISELLEIKILDATRPNDYKWIDKQATIKKVKLYILNSVLKKLPFLNNIKPCTLVKYFCTVSTKCILSRFLFF